MPKVWGDSESKKPMVLSLSLAEVVFGARGISGSVSILFFSVHRFKTVFVSQVATTKRKAYSIIWFPIQQK